jgi:cytochrome c oxidase subunit 4
MRPVSGEPLPFRTYLRVFVALLVLASLTTLLDFVNLGPFHTPAALTIATLKAVLVALFFMGLIHSPALMRVAVGAGVLWLAILLMLTLVDYLTRGLIPAPGK